MGCAAQSTERSDHPAVVFPPMRVRCVIRRAHTIYFPSLHKYLSGQFRWICNCSISLRLFHPYFQPRDSSQPLLRVDIHCRFLLATYLPSSLSTARHYQTPSTPRFLSSSPPSSPPLLPTPHETLLLAPLAKETSVQSTGLSYSSLAIPSFQSHPNSPRSQTAGKNPTWHAWPLHCTWGGRQRKTKNSNPCNL